MRILHVPYTYLPDPIGGTEVYVRGLARELAAFGCTSVIAAPASVASAYVIDAIDVHRFATDPVSSRGYAYGTPDAIAADGFRAVVAQVKPDIVHLHARTAAVSELLVDVAHAAGARVVFTYHTPTVSCARGTMLLHGAVPCDGYLEPARCAACALTAHGVLKSAAQLLAKLPAGVHVPAARFAGRNRLCAALAVPGYVAASQARFHALMQTADHVVAVCNWVADLLACNGVPAAKMTLCRQGVDQRDNDATVGTRDCPGSPLRLAYFGRIDRTKGLDLLVTALARCPQAAVQLDIYGVAQGQSNAMLDGIAAAAERDGRIRILNSVPADRVRAQMAQYDMLAVPSRGLETGPLVVLEAFAAGVPVLGANLGGIAELVRDGVDGVLVAPDDVRAWAQAIAGLCQAPERIAALRQGIWPPRTMRDVAADMAAIYERLLGARASANAG